MRIDARMRRMKTSLAIVAVGTLLAGCAQGAKNAMADSDLGYASSKDTVSVDWSKVETVNMTVADFEFQPASLSFQSGGIYRLHLENKGKETHYFAAEDFFKAIAANSLEQSEGNIANPLLREIALAPGESKDLTFIAVTKGSYDLHCSAPFHEGMGMKGTIAIL